MKRVIVTLAAAGLMLSQMAATHAATFANFTGINGTAPPGVELLNYNSGGTQIPVNTYDSTYSNAILQTVGPSGAPGADQVDFYYRPGIPEVGAPVGTAIPANLNYTASTAQSVNPITGTTTGALNFDSVTLAVTPIGTAPTPGKNNLLTMTVSTILLNGASGLLSATALPSNTATFGGSDLVIGGTYETTVTFTSDYINFAGATNKGYAIGYSGITPLYQTESGAMFDPIFINQFLAEEAGTFSATGLTPPNLPEPGAISMLLGLGISSSLFLRRRRR